MNINSYLIILYKTIIKSQENIFIKIFKKITKKSKKLQIAKNTTLIL